MAIETKTSVDVQTLPPFKRFIMSIGALPTSYLESMSYAELLMWFCNFLQEQVIPAVNNNADAIREIQDFLNTLDLQDEVDHKLDEMVEDGTLQEIIADYLNSKAIFGFDTVASMKSATNLIDGSYAKTLGYHAKNDGGMATYKIRQITNDDVVDEMFIISLNNDNLIAELININTNVKQLGAVENTNITNIIENSISTLGYVNINDGTYNCNINITTDDDIKILGKNCLLKPYNVNYPVINIYCTDITKNKIIKNIDLQLKNNEIGIKIAKHSETSRLYHPQKVNISNININCESTFTGKGIELEYLSELNIEHIYVKRSHDNTNYTGTGIAISSCVNLNLYNSSFGYLNKGVDIYTNNKSCEGIMLNNVELLFNNYGVTAISSTSYNILSVRVVNCMIDQIQKYGILFDGIMASSIINNWLGANDVNSDCILLQSTNKQLFQTVIDNNMIWLNNKSNSYGIRISRNNSYNIFGTNISNNTLFNYNEKAIYIDNSNSISYLTLNNNYFSTSSGIANTPLSYNAVPTNCKIVNCNNGGSAYKISDDIIIKNCINMDNNKIFTADDITTGSNQQNNSINTLKLCITASATGSRGYIAVQVGHSLSTLAQRYTQAIESGGQGVVYVTVPPKGYYNISGTSAINISSIYGYYE